jgi:hypothetical protein
VPQRVDSLYIKEMSTVYKIQQVLAKEEEESMVETLLDQVKPKSSADYVEGMIWITFIVVALVILCMFRIEPCKKRQHTKQKTK